MPTMPVKAAGWRMEPPVSVAVAPRHRPAATAPAEPPEEPPRPSGGLAPFPPPGAAGGPRARPRVLFASLPPRGGDGRPERRTFVRRAHGKLVVVELAQHHRAVAPEIGADGRLVARQKIVEDARARRGAHVLGGEHVLDAEREALERARVARFKARIGRRRHGACPLRSLQHIGIERACLLYGGEMRVGELGGGELPPPKAVACVRERQKRKGGHSAEGSQANVSAARSGGLGRPGLWPLVTGCGGDKPRACKSSAVTPGGISLRARNFAHHRRKKYSCCSQARHIDRRLPEILGSRCAFPRMMEYAAGRSFHHFRHHKEMV